MFEATSVAGKRDAATAEGQPVTARRMSKKDATCSTLIRPVERKMIDQRLTNHTQGNESQKLSIGVKELTFRIPTRQRVTK